MPPAFPESPVTGSECSLTVARQRGIYTRFPSLSAVDKDTRTLMFAKNGTTEEQTIIGREGEVNRSVSAACLGLSELHQPGHMCIASHEWICTHRANARLGESQLFYVFVRHFTSEEI